VEAAIRYAVGKGCFVAIAAGNDFTTGNPTEVIAEIASRVQGAVSVAAVNPAKGHAFYSSTGPWVELTAPGGEVPNTCRNGQIHWRLMYRPCSVTCQSGQSMWGWS
jgi:subtilisin family serine protease